MRISDYIKITANDRKQIITLAIISIILITISLSYTYITNQQAKKYIIADTTIKNKIQWLQNTTEEYADDNQALSRLDRKIISIYDTLTLFNFNPNTVTKNELLKLGLTEKQATTIEKYRNNGGKFSTKEDFKKMYGLRTKQYQILEPYIMLKSEKEIIKTNEKNVQTVEYKPFDPNFVTEEELIKMNFTAKQAQALINDRTSKGKKFYCINDVKNYYLFKSRFPDLEQYIKINIEKLGNGIKLHNINELSAKDLETILDLKPTDAQKIEQARNILGAFYSTSQLKDIGISSNTYNQIKNTLYICSGEKLKKININQISVQELENHPYFTQNQAIKTIEYRQENGKISNIETLKSLGIFDNRQLKNIEKYVEF